MNISELQGVTLISFTRSNDELIFTDSSYKNYKFFHDQDCCEHVYIQDITGDLNDLLDTPLLMAEESSNSEEHDYGSQTWTFYKFATIKGYVTVRWYGSSNGYYSEGVSLDVY